MDDHPFSSFETFWQKLMGTRHNLPSTVAFATDRSGRKFPVRASDKRIAEFFWQEAIAHERRKYGHGGGGGNG